MGWEVAKTSGRQRSMRRNPGLLTVVIPHTWVRCYSQPNIMHSAYQGDHLPPRLLLMINMSRLVNNCSPRCSMVVPNDLGVCLSEEGWAGGRFTAHLLGTGLAMAHWYPHKYKVNLWTRCQVFSISITFLHVDHLHNGAQQRC